MEDNQAQGGGPLESLGAKIDTLASDVKDMNEQLNGRIDTLNTAVGDMSTRLNEGLSGVESRLSGAETRLSGVETRLSGVETHLADVGKQLAKVQITADDTKEFSRNSWDSLESLRTNVADGFEKAKKERDKEFQLVHSAIRHLGEKVQRIEEAPSRARNREL